MSENENGTLEGSVVLTDPVQIFDCGQMFAMRAAIEEVRSLNINAAGVGLALAVLEKHDAENRVRAMQRNLRTAYRAGADLGQTSVLLRLEGGQLILSWKADQTGEPA